MIQELLGPDAKAICEGGNPGYISEFKDILADKVAAWGQPWTRTTTSKSSIIQAVNYYKMRAIPVEPKFKTELEDFISAFPC
jgi:hypothetical protein